jgi:hypothetical protein
MTQRCVAHLQAAVSYVWWRLLVVCTCIRIMPVKPVYSAEPLNNGEPLFRVVLVEAKTIYLAANNFAFIVLLKAHFIQGL